MTFFILSVRYREGGDWEDRFQTRYDSGADAQAEAKRHNDYNSRWNYRARWRVRKVVDTDSDNFYAREKALNHTPVPWELSTAFENSWAYMLPHIDPDDPKKVRFYRTLTHAIEGRYTSVRMSKFLVDYERFDEEERDEILAKAGFWNGEDVEFAITQDADKIQEVYENGPNSCMADPDEYSLPDPHPVTVYSKGDLALAYVRRGDEYTARGVIYPEKQLYWSMYGHTALLENHLKDLGYIEDPQGGRGFEGAKVAAIPYDDGYLMPYIDAVSTASLVTVDDELYFELKYSSGDFDVRVTEGYTYE